MKVLNRDAIKCFAMFAMLLNHVGHVMMEPGSVLYHLFLNIGYFTAPTMCYFLAEGYQYTKSKMRYGLRLLGFAVFSQIPFSLALFAVPIQFEYWNMMFTLFFCFLILVVKEHVQQPFLQMCLYILLILATSSCDWPITAAVYTLMFAYSLGRKEDMKRSYLSAVILFAFVMYSPYASVWSLVGGCLAVVCSGIVILYFYNGKRAAKGQKFLKWFFYLFYPVHLLVLGVMSFK